jgi:hypothetical protein
MPERRVRVTAEVIRVLYPGKSFLPWAGKAFSGRDDRKILPCFALPRIDNAI